ncbi:MAG: hypothetical protein EKK48_24120 [Candidatus Melainabacteria bacterium]|jgi:hypothetical protein|nr:MAG: hypothetical protein EKK48_24120 [Candidatus Melainabacteria bacterium]
MKIKFEDYADSTSPERTFESASELRDFIDQQTKITGQLICSNGFALTIGIDGEIIFAEYMKDDGDSSYFMALSPKTIVEGSHDFIMAGAPSEILGKYCLPIELLKTVAVDFSETGSRSTAVK